MTNTYYTYDKFGHVIANNRTEQVTHYYPYGALMADISTSPTLRILSMAARSSQRIERLIVVQREDEL